MKIKNIEVDINHHNIYGLFNSKDDLLNRSEYKKIIDLVIKNKKDHYISLYEQIFNQKINTTTYKVFSHKFRHHIYYILNKSNIKDHSVETIIIDYILDKIDYEFKRFSISLNKKFFIFKNEQLNNVIRKKNKYYVWEDVKKDFYLHFVEMGLVIMPVDSEPKKQRFFNQRLILNKDFQELLGKKEASFLEVIEYIKKERMFFMFEKK